MEEARRSVTGCTSVGAHDGRVWTARQSGVVWHTHRLTWTGTLLRPCLLRPAAAAGSAGAAAGEEGPGVPGIRSASAASAAGWGRAIAVGAGRGRSTVGSSRAGRSTWSWHESGRAGRTSGKEMAQLKEGSKAGRDGRQWSSYRIGKRKVDGGSRDPVSTGRSCHRHRPAQAQRGTTALSGSSSLATLLLAKPSHSYTPVRARDSSLRALASWRLKLMCDGRSGD